MIQVGNTTTGRIETTMKIEIEEDGRNTITAMTKTVLGEDLVLTMTQNEKLKEASEIEANG